MGEIGLDFSPHVLEPKQQQPCSTQDSSPPQQHDGDGTDSQQQHQQPHAGTLPTAEELKEVQRAVFKQQIQLANELGLPVNVHSRSAGHHAVRTVVSGFSCLNGAGGGGDAAGQQAGKCCCWLLSLMQQTGGNSSKWWCSRTTKSLAGCTFCGLHCVLHVDHCAGGEQCPRRPVTCL